MVERIAGVSLSPEGRRQLSVSMNSPSMGESPPPPSRVDIRGYLPPEMVGCSKMVTDILERDGEQLTLVDVSREEVRPDLISRYFGPDNVLPMLVGPDGRKLEGLVEFTPKRIRKFVAQYRGTP